MTKPTTPDAGSTADHDRLELLLGATVSVAVFAFHFVLEMVLYRMGAFESLNTLFNADPGFTVQALCCGGGSNHIAHPLLEYFFSIPIGGIVKLAGVFASEAFKEEAARHAVAMVVVPAASGIQTFVMLRLLRALGMTLRSALLVAALGAISFGKLVFGSMPESYCLSALAMALAFALFMKTRERRGVRVEMSWLAAGVFTAGVTLTNVVPVAMLYFLRDAELGRSFWSRSARALAGVALVLGVSLGIGFVLDEAFDAAPSRTPSEGAWIERYFVDDWPVQLFTFPTAVMNGIAPPAPMKATNKFAFAGTRKVSEKVRGVRTAVKRPRGSQTPISRPSAAGAQGADSTGVGASTTVEPQTQPVGTSLPGEQVESPSTARPAAPENPGAGQVPDADTRAKFKNSPDTAGPEGAGVESVTSGGPAPAVEGDEKPVGTAAAEREAQPESDRIVFSLTYQKTHRLLSLRNIVGYLVLAALAWFAFRDRTLEPPFSSLARLSFAVVAFNWVFHSFWGGEQFLYSQHWRVPLVVLFAAAFAGIERRFRWAFAVLTVVVAGVAVSNGVMLSRMLSMLVGE